MSTPDCTRRGEAEQISQFCGMLQGWANFQVAWSSKAKNVCCAHVAANEHARLQAAAVDEMGEKEV
jgi:hypothetical protein